MAGTQVGAVDRALPSSKLRLNVLALPSPTTSRFLLLVVALLSAGAIVGNWIHNETAGDAWAAHVLRCEQQANAQVTQLSGDQALIQQNALAQQCRASSERLRAVYLFAGVAVAGLAGLVVLLAVPRIVERRRQLQHLDGALRPASQRFSELAGEAGLSTTVTPMVGPVRLVRDAFSYGLPGRYRVVLPKAVAIQPANAAVFDPVVRHELAHITHRDVVYAWLAKAMWLALLPVLAVPVVFGVAASSRALLLDYVWRSGLLMITAELISRALLRSREHDADLRAALGPGGAPAVTGVLERSRTAPRSRWWRRGLLANHPTQQERVAAVHAPERVAGVTALDAFTAAFLAAIIVPTVNSALATVLGTVARSDLAWLIAALVAGPLLGGSVGLGLWRATTVLRAVDKQVRVAPVAGGVAAGLVIGQIVALEQLAAGIFGGFDRPIVLLFAALAGTGATVLSAGLAEVSADAAPAWRSTKFMWIGVVLVNSLLFATTLWAVQAVQNALDFAGWTIAGAFLVTLFTSPLTLLTTATAAAMVAWSLWRTRPDALTPAWLVADGEPVPWPVHNHRGLRSTAAVGLASGLAAGLVMIAYRLLAGAAVTDAEAFTRFYTFQWIIASASGTATLVLVLAVPRRGVGLSLLAGPAAAATAIIAFLALNTALGGDLTAEFVSTTARGPVPLGLLLSLLVAPVGLLRWTGHRRAARPVAQWASAVALGAVVSVAVLLGRGPLTGELPERTAAANVPVDPRSDAPVQMTVERYVVFTAGDIGARVTAIDGLLSEINEAPSTGPQRAARIRAELLPPTRDLLDDALAVDTTDDAVSSVHQHSVTALESIVTAFDLYATALETQDVETFADGEAAMQEAQQSWVQWQMGVTTMLDRSTPP